MKHLIVASFLSIIISYPLSAQEKKEPIEQEVIGHIYKPKNKKPTSKLIKDLKLPKGFKIDIYAKDLGSPRMMAQSSNGNIYVTRREGDILKLTDSNNDGKADKRDTVLTKKNVHGIDIQRDSVYLITVNEVFKTKIDSFGNFDKLTPLVKDLPDGGQHNNRTLAMGPDGDLYVSVGSTCNACAETREENATIIRVDPHSGAYRIFAKGLRNTIGFDWQPGSDILYGMDHGIDWLGDNDQKEELNKIVEGGHYGWPYIYADGKFNKADEPKDMNWQEFAKKTTEPELLFTAHSSPLDFIFYRGDMFPPAYKNKALVSFRGSWNRLPASGYKIISVNFQNNRPVGEEDLVTGFLADDGKSQFARLAGLLELMDGSVLACDDENGIIYRITYQK
ncbi:PQQ-dependent sugar dehydrogenase [Zobellia alginiliquefaciens]|uniref:PQQ-dependent sugar dehydrogenase n=1 Tax=Zobellia alginiliquefaciens TaxID=3032586 RepID=UPI0023E3AA8A|nr:PQQ-dependent sugar dehydrogenase [Zobellia alginiliquefaciens]